MNPIANEYDGPLPPIRKLKTKYFALDYIYSENATELDSGIRETMQGVRMSIMAMGIALYRFLAAGYYVDLGFKRAGQYVDKLSEDTGFTRANIYNWSYIGEAYVKNRAELEKIGFNDDDGPTKLPFLSRALENYPRKTDVFRNLKAMSKREFAEWSRGLGAPPAGGSKRYKSVKVRGNQVLIRGEPLVVFAEGLSPEDRRYYERILLAGAQAKEVKEVIGVYHFYDDQERQRFDRVYDREIRVLRTK
jgi:hypothetical protein